MPIGVQNFTPLSFEQANPFLSGFQAAQTPLSTMIAQHLGELQAQTAAAKLPYVGQEEKQALQKAIYENMMAAPKAQMAPQFAQAELSQAQALPGLTAAQARQALAQSGYLGTEADMNRFKLKNPGLIAGGAPAELAGLKLMGINTNPVNQPGNAPQGNAPSLTDAVAASLPNPAPFRTGNPMVDAILNAKPAETAYKQQMVLANAWIHSPQSAKEYDQAVLAGAGIDPSESNRLLSTGRTVPEILQSKGFDPKNPPDPDFLPTHGDISRLKQRQAALNEVENLGEFITEGLGKYARTIGGMSPPQVADALLGQNKEDQIKFLAARGLAPELSNLRLSLAGAKTGHGAQEEMMNKSLMNVGAYQSLVSPDVYKAAQNLMDKKLSEAFSKAEEAYTVGKKARKSESKSPMRDLSHLSDDELRKIANGQ